MNSHKKISKIIIVLIGILLGGFALQANTSAYFNPQVKKSKKGNWMQCYALQYSKKTGGGTFLAGAKIGHVASTERLCAYVDSDGNMLTGNIGKYSEPSGTASLIEDLGGLGNPKVYFEVGSDKHTISFYQCNDGSYGSECTSSLAKTWTAKKGANFEKLAKEINDLANDKYGDYTKMSFEDTNNTGSLTQEESQNITYNNGGSNSVCYEGSGALGWILCPIIRGLSAAGENMWEAVSGMLNIPANETFNSDSGVVVAWETIRNIANIMFIILLLVVIFSQLTGVGIDNYGIKRILPKMIIAAVLINLSYVICEVAVDISNILGNSLEGLLASQAGSIDLGTESSVGSTVAASMVDAALVGGGAYLFTLFNPLGTIAIGIAVVSIIIAIVTAIAFMYLILVIRQAGVILMVVLAPAAIVCYMLPNTEKIYKRWFDTFKALLVVYPICGAIVGGGQLASYVLGSIDNTAMKIAAMIVQVVPFFLIPTLLRNSLSLMGDIGQRLQNVAGRARRGATGVAANAMRNSERLKSFDNRLGMHSISSRRRANAVESQGAIMAARGKRARLSDRNNIETRLAAIAAGEEIKAADEAANQSLALMQSRGITMDNGVTVAYNRDGVERRLRELAARQTLTNNEQTEVDALMKGAIGFKGGASSIGGIMRGGASEAFMRTAGGVYSRDANVRSKMNEKDLAASLYTEEFTHAGGGAGAFNGGYDDLARTRTQSAEQGLNQSRVAARQYIERLSPEDFRAIRDNEQLFNNLDDDVRHDFMEVARSRNIDVENASPRRVVIDQGGNPNP